MYATQVFFGKREWTQIAKDLFDSQDAEMAFNIFQEGLVESGFTKCGGFSGVERWALKDTEIIVNVNSINYTFTVFPYTTEYSVLEGRILFPLIRKRWEELTFIPKGTDTR